MEGLIFLVTLVIIIIIFIYNKLSVKKRRKNLLYIEGFEFPATIRKKVKEKYTHLNNADIDKVEVGLREWFYVCHFARGKPVSMPSQVVDVAWHEFILFTKFYNDFCLKAFGKFLHHNPAEAMESDKIAQKGIKTAWKISCTRENIAPHKPKRLPILFGLDSKLKIPGGFKYSLNCDGPRSDGYCATHIGCSSASSCSSCSSDDGGSSCGSGCSGGD